MAYTQNTEPLDLTAKTTPIDADVVIIGDSADASEVAKKTTWANVKATLKTYNDTLYAAVLGADDNYVTDAEKTVIGNTSGTNTGNQTVTNTSDATSHTVTLSASGGSVQMIEGTNITLTTGGTGSAGTVTITASGGSGDVTKVGTPVNNQIGVWTGDGTLEGDADLTFDTATNTLTSVNINATTFTGALTGIASGNLVSGGALGTPSSGTLTNATGLPLAGVVDSTTEALGVGSLEVGHASDTTLSRVSAGVVAVEGVNLLRTSDVDDTPINGATTDPVSSNWAFDHSALASSDTVVGHIEVATTAETNTGTDAIRAVSPDGLSQSYAGTKSVSIQVYDGATDVATGDGKAYITIPEALNGMNLIRAQATVVTAGTTGATTVMIHNKTDANDMLSGAISIASAGTVGTVGTINGSFDDVATNDVLRIDVDSVSTTAPKGLQVILEFRLP